MKSQNSNSEFGVYTTNGELLGGSLSGYSDTASVLDSKRVAIFIECTPTELILGTRMMVRIVGGREERAIYFQKYPKTATRIDEAFVRQFYSDAIAGIQNLSKVKYESLGIWEKNDWNFKTKHCTFSSLSFVIGKILLKEPVTLKITDFSLSLSAIVVILQELVRSCPVPVKLMYAHYTLETDVLFSPNAIKPDVEISETKESISITISKTLVEYYEGIFSLYLQYQESDPAHFRGKTRDEIEKALRTEIITRGNRVQQNFISNPKELISIYRDNIGALYHLASIAVKNPRVLFSFDEETSKKIIEYRVSLPSRPLNSPEDYTLIRDLYRNIKTETKRREVQKLLISNAVQEDYLLSDILTRAVQTGDVSDLKFFFESATIGQEQVNKLVSTVFSAHNYDQKTIINFIEIVVRSDIDRNTTGEYFLESIKSYYKRHNYDIKKLNRLLSTNGRPEIPVPRRQPVNRKGVSGYILIILVIIIGICIACAILIYLNILPLPVFLPSGNVTLINGTSGNISPTT